MNETDGVPMPSDIELEAADRVCRERKATDIIPKFADLTDEQQQSYVDKATEILTGLLWCDRAWEAWDVGTMTQRDFYNADEDDGCVGDTAKLLYDFVQAQQRQAQGRG